MRLASATAGTPTWDNIPVDMIERIEVLKGPASALYGSDGVGGVVQVFTRSGQEGFHPNASVTLGSGRHRKAAARRAGGQGALGYSVGVQSTRETGFRATNERVPFGSLNPDPDGFRQDAVNASVRYDSAATGASTPACCIPKASPASTTGRASTRAAPCAPPPPMPA